jgi:predicted glycosyltransferase
MLKPLRENRGANYFVYRGVTGQSEIKRGVLAKASAKVLRDHYRQILVVCDSRICDVVAQHGLPPELARKVTYCGYLVEDVAEDRIARVRRERGVPPSARWIVGSVGGGWNGSSILAACLRLAEEIDGVYLDLVIGPRGCMELPVSPVLADRVRVHQSKNGLDLLHAACDLLICAGGYNTLVEAMAGRTPLIVLPSQPDPADEQYAHARRLASFYPVELLTDHAQLESLVRGQLADLDGLRHRACGADLDFDGLAAVRRIVKNSE